MPPCRKYARIVANSCISSTLINLVFKEFLHNLHWPSRWDFRLSRMLYLTSCLLLPECMLLLIHFLYSIPFILKIRSQYCAQFHRNFIVILFIYNLMHKRQKGVPWRQKEFKDRYRHKLYNTCLFHFIQLYTRRIYFVITKVQRNFWNI